MKKFLVVLMLGLFAFSSAGEIPAAYAADSYYAEKNPSTTKPSKKKAKKKSESPSPSPREENPSK
jgi:hypothetical protein